MSMKETMKNLSSNKNVWWGVVALIIIIVLVVTVGKGEGKKMDDSMEENVDTNSPTALQAAQPVVAGDYEYAFSGVEWIFDTEDPLVVGTGQTYLKMMFADFTRNGNAITFGRPYKLGFHSGTCKSIDFLDTAELKGIPIAYAQCTDGALARDFAVVQDSENITVFMNEKVGEDETGYQEWYKINVTEVVK